MNIAKAIEIKQSFQRKHYHIMSVDEVIADTLSIEALKWVKRYRPDNKTDRWSLLPGEIEE